MDLGDHALACVANTVSAQPRPPGSPHLLCTHLPASVGSSPTSSHLWPSGDAPWALELHPFHREPKAFQVAFSQCPAPVKVHKPRTLCPKAGQTLRCNLCLSPSCDQAASGISLQLHPCMASSPSPCCSPALLSPGSAVGDGGVGQRCEGHARLSGIFVLGSPGQPVVSQLPLILAHTSLTAPPVLL